MDIEQFFIAIMVISAYMLPSIIAGARHHHNGRAIMVLNIFLGWTFLGWVAALVWSFTQVQQTARRAYIEPDPPMGSADDIPSHLRRDV